MSTDTKEVKRHRARDSATLEQERTTTDNSKGSNSTSSDGSSRRHHSKSKRQEWVLDADTQMLRKEPRDTIFDENGALKPKYQTTDIPPLASGVSVYLQGSTNQAPTLLKRAKLPLSARANRIIGRNKKLYTYVPWAS